MTTPNTQERDKTIREVVMEHEAIEHSKMIQALLDNPAIRKTRHGYEIDILNLVSQLTEEKKKLVVQFITKSN